MPRQSPSRALAHEARTVLTAAHARLQRLRRKTDRGEVDCAAFLAELDVACLAVRRASALLDALEAGAAGPPPPAAPPPNGRHPDA